MHEVIQLGCQRLCIPRDWLEVRTPREYHSRLDKKVRRTVLIKDRQCIPENSNDTHETLLLVIYGVHLSALD